MPLSDQDIVSQFQLVSQALDAHRQALESVIEQVGLFEGMVRENVQPETKMLVLLNGILLGVLRSKGMLSEDEAAQIGELARTLMGADNPERTAAVTGLVNAACRAVMGEGPPAGTDPAE